MTFGMEVARLSAERGFTSQQQLADASGLSQSFIARVMSGKRKDVTFDAILALSEALGVPCEHFRPFFKSAPSPLPPSPPVTPPKPRRRKPAE